MKLTIKINLDHAAMVDDMDGELRRILTELVDRLPADDTTAPINLYDANGNNVGTARLTDC